VHHSSTVNGNGKLNGKATTANSSLFTFAHTPNPRARRKLARIKPVPQVTVDDTASPRKRKRDEEADSEHTEHRGSRSSSLSPAPAESSPTKSSESGSWVETDDEMVLDLIREGESTENAKTKQHRVVDRY